MEFTVTLINVLIMLAYIIPGFLITKLNKTNVDHLPTLSSVLVYICSPCLMFTSLLSIECTIENVKGMLLFLLVVSVCQIAFMLIVYLAFFKKRENGNVRFFTIASTSGNVGFFGLPLVKAILPNNPEVVIYASMAILSMNVIIFTLGVFLLSGKKEYVSLKSAFLNPTVFGLSVALPFFISGTAGEIPSVISNAIELLGKASTPLCMIILGVRLANMSFKKVFLNKTAYLSTLGKLVIYPLFTLLCVAFLPVPEVFKISAVVLAGSPCAVFIYNMAEIHGGDKESAANSVLLSTVLCFITLPLITLLLSVVL